MKKKIDLTFLFFYIFIGVPVLFGYSRIPKQKLIGSFHPNIIRAYIPTIILSFIAGLYILGYYISVLPLKNNHYEKNEKYYAYLSFLIFLTSATIWPIGLIYQWSKEIIIFGLFGTALGVAMILAQIVSVFEKNNLVDTFAIVFACILLFQTLVMDLGLWSFLTYYYYSYSSSMSSSFGKKVKVKKTKRTNEKLWKKIVLKIKKSSRGGKKNQWSARKAQLAVKEYKKLGGKYPDPKSKSNKLVKWTKQNWNTKSGKNSVIGNRATGERYLPKKARKALSKKEYKKTSMKKRRDILRGKQFSKQPKKIAKKTSI